MPSGRAGPLALTTKRLDLYAGPRIQQQAKLTIYILGFRMILLQILTRFHVLFTLIAAQVLCSASTSARATAPIIRN